MSKQSAKQRYEQLMEWLDTFSKTQSHRPNKKNVNKQSRMSYYKDKGVE